MSDVTFSDNELMAYADGELAEARASEIDFALVSDTALAERLALFVDTRARMSDAFAPMLDEPVPDALMQNIRKLAEESDAAQNAPEEAESTIVAFRPRAAPPEASRRPFWQMAVAATLALAIGLGAGIRLGDNQPTGGLQIAALSDPYIVSALSEMSSGERRLLDSGSEITIIATFLDEFGAVCREFEYDKPESATLVSVTCYDTEWRVKFAVAAAPANDTGYAPASSLAALDAYLLAIGAGAPLTLEDEAQALAKLAE